MQPYIRLHYFILLENTMKIKELGEFGLIDILKNDTINNQDDIIKGIGDDAAVFKVADNLLQLASTDMLVENVHFDLSFISPWQLGYKSVAVNLSDIAAMGGTPSNILISIAIPCYIDVDFMVQLYNGMKAIAKEFKVNIIGGDTVSSPEGLVINITVLGSVSADLVKYRSGAKAGDLVVVTGSIGDSAAGLDILLHKYNKENYTEVIKKHLLPFPQVDSGTIIASYANCMNDISDGLASEANEIAVASDKGIILNEEALPISKDVVTIAEVFAKDVLDYALYGGEDYQLVFTISPENFVELKQKISSLTIVGEVTDNFKSVKLQRRDGTLLEIKSKEYNHFR